MQSDYLFLHLHKIAKWLYFQCSLSVCVSVCQSTKFQRNGFGCSCWMVVNHSALNPIEIGNLYSKGQCWWISVPFLYLHYAVNATLWVLAALFVCVCAPCPQIELWKLPTYFYFFFKWKNMPTPQSSQKIKTLQETVSLKR